MTEQYYNCDLTPGMIADLSYKFEVGDHYFPDYPPFLREQKWFCQHMKGVFRFSGGMSSHWLSHVQISHPDDGVLIKMVLSNVKTWTESIINGNHHVPQRVFTSVEEYDEPILKRGGKASVSIGEFWRPLQIGEDKVDVTFVREWLRKYPYAVTSMSESIRTMEHDERRKKQQ